MFDKPWKNLVATFYHERCEARTNADVDDAIKAGPILRLKVFWDGFHDREKNAGIFPSSKPIL